MSIIRAVCLLKSSTRYMKYKRVMKVNMVARAQIHTIGVIGGGQMGMGIAITAAQKAKKKVICVDQNTTALERSFEFSKKSLASQVSKGKLTAQEKDDTISRITTTSDMGKLKDVDFVIEAVTENEDIKRTVFKDASQITRKDVILTSNTSSIPITRIASWVDEHRRDKVCGMHFMNPVPIMALVEIIPGLQTSESTKTQVIALAEEMGKTTTISRDKAGFIVNRILMPYINEAIFVLEEGIASKEDIDKGMKLGTNVPMGPLTLADFIGLDTCLFIQQTLYESTKDSKYRPAPLLQRYVEAGWLGRKTGRGFYTYEIRK